MKLAWQEHRRHLDPIEKVWPLLMFHKHAAWQTSLPSAQALPQSFSNLWNRKITLGLWFHAKKELCNTPWCCKILHSLISSAALLLAEYSGRYIVPPISIDKSSAYLTRLFFLVERLRSWKMYMVTLRTTEKIQRPASPMTRMVATIYHLRTTVTNHHVSTMM